MSYAATKVGASTCNVVWSLEDKEDGISLFGRVTPAYILEEVKRRQNEERGTSSAWARLAVDYGPKHANFIIKQKAIIPTSRNDKNSWGHIAQSFAGNKQRPSSAPELRKSSIDKKGKVTLSRNKKGWQAQHRANIDDIATHKNGPQPLFQRTCEIHAVIDIIQATKKARLPQKVKKGLRRKMAEAAMAAAKLGEGTERDSEEPHRSHSPPRNPADNLRRTSTLRGKREAQNGGRSTTGVPNTSNDTQPRSPCSRQKGIDDLGAENQAKIPRRVRNSARSHGCKGKRRDHTGLLRGTAVDSADCHRRSVVGASRPHLPRSEEEDKNKNIGAEDCAEEITVVRQGRPFTGRNKLSGAGRMLDGENLRATPRQLGVVDISSLTRILSHAQACGYSHKCGGKFNLSNNDKFDIKFEGGRAFLSAEGTGTAHPQQEQTNHASERLSTGAAANECSEMGAGPLEPEAHSIKSEDDSIEEERVDGDTTKKYFVDGSWCAEPLEKAKLREVSAMPQLDCLKGRYARAETRCKSSYAANKKAAAMSVLLQPHAASLDMSASTSRYRHRNGSGNVSTSSGANGATGTTDRAARAGGRRRRGLKGGALSWLERLVAVQKRRAVLEGAKRVAAEGVAKRRKEKKALMLFDRSGAEKKELASAPVVVRGATCFVDPGHPKKLKLHQTNLEAERNHMMTREVSAAKTIQLAYRRLSQYRLWLGDKLDRIYLSRLLLEEEAGSHCRAPYLSSDQRGPSSGADPGSAKDHSHSTLVDSVAFNKARKLRHRKITIRTKRMARGFLNCTQARLLLLKLLWDRVEGSIMNKQRSNRRAAAASSGAVTLQQISNIRRMAVGLIKLQNDADTFKLEHQYKHGKNVSSSKSCKRRGENQTSGGFESAQQIRSEKKECETILREHGRRGRRLVDLEMRDRFLLNVLYSYRRQHIAWDQSEYLRESSHPPFVDSRDVKRMLACPAEEMHMFSDPQNYRTRPRYTRLVLPFREIEGTIQDSILSHVKSKYLDKIKETLGPGTGVNLRFEHSTLPPSTPQPGAVSPASPNYPQRTMSRVGSAEATAQPRNHVQAVGLVNSTEKMKLITPRPPQ